MTFGRSMCNVTWNQHDGRGFQARIKIGTHLSHKVQRHLGAETVVQPTSPLILKFGTAVDFQRG